MEEKYAVGQHGKQMSVFGDSWNDRQCRACVTTRRKGSRRRLKTTRQTRKKTDFMTFRIFDFD